MDWNRAFTSRLVSAVFISIVGTALTLWPALARPAGALVVVEHAGADDPVSQGWGASGFTNVAVGPVLNDLGSGLDAWKVDDNGTEIGDAGFSSLGSSSRLLGRAPRLELDGRASRDLRRSTSVGRRDRALTHRFDDLARLRRLHPHVVGALHEGI